MPMRMFNCEAGRGIPVKTCLAACPKGDRCLSLPTLHKIGWMKEAQRGKFSTTTLLKPTRQAFLEITSDYAIVPKERAFLLAGTEHHARLEAVAKHIEGVKPELRIPDFEITSVLDNLEPDEKAEGCYKLIDYKFVGAYSIAKMLAGDFGDYDWQVNHYRTQAERFGLSISRLFIQYTARDLTGQTAARFKDIFTDAMALIPIPKYPDDEVLGFFDRRREALEMALARNELPEICEDRWGERKCKQYCDVAASCEHGRLYMAAREGGEEG